MNATRTRLISTSRLLNKSFVSHQKRVLRRNMASTSTPIPIVLCGRSDVVGKSVSEFLRPEFEVIHFLQTFEAATADLPLVIAGNKPASPATNDVGTQDYSKPPRAIVLGRAFDPEQVDKLRKMCEGKNQVSVAWMLGDPAKKPTGPPAPGYAKEVSQEVKNLLKEWLASSQANEDKVIYY